MELFSKTAATTVAAIGMSFALTACTATNPLVTKSQREHEAKVQAIPKCGKKLGSISVIEPEGGVHWWTQQQLPSPTRLIKVFVQKSGCFTLVDRGMGMNAAMRERELAAGGDLRGGSNLGKGQIKVADYVMVPDLVASNRNAGGAGLGALVGGLIGGPAGAVASNITINSKTADVVLTVTDVRSSEQVALTEGHGEKNDLGFGVSGGIWGSSAAGGAAVGAYANTPQGQVITMAYLDAYTKLVSELGGLPGSASAANARQAGTVNKPSTLRAAADVKSKAVRKLEPGMPVYPTGDKMGLQWEVEDEHGNRGWLSSENFDLTR
ncbi:CsgG/HfaB family protein [Luteibacter aegosomatissinici]|uniref:CsgG/HfaB family protein n=1 Tax=Luteibacter aegosomatissinici TaxID=2911539 RepID=UPI001FF9B78B|nr:CsgG/HfaB family protein [Luteibacter aegosomatissinici]UPG93272.1 CsgG/HfaB family protein [Luteibacter aegosomatissinici]